jgi:hypothetical protein
MYPTSNSFVFDASFSSTRNHSNSMRNNDSSRLIAGTGSIRPCGASGSNHDRTQVGSGALIRHGQSLPRYGLQKVNSPVKSCAAQ